MLHRNEAVPVHLFFIRKIGRKKTIVCKVCVVFFPDENWEEGEGGP